MKEATRGNVQPEVAPPVAAVQVDGFIPQAFGCNSRRRSFARLILKARWMTLALRPYQQAAVKAVYEHLRTRDDNPAVVLPTAAGKAFIIAQIATDAVLKWGGRVLVLAHVKELLEQNAEKIRRLCPEVPIGIYSAGLNRRETDKPVIVAGIQSVYKRACELDAFDLAIVDECFVAGTLIATPYGELAIETIRPGDVVHTALGPGRVRAIRSRAVTELVHLEVSDGTRISCTPNHRFFTCRGWTKASALEVGEVLFGREDVRALWHGVPAVEETPSQRQGICLPREAVGQAALLLDLLFEEACQPYEPERRATESSPATEGNSAPADPPGRQRSSPHAAAAGAVTCLGRRLGGRGGRPDRHAEGFGIPHSLQAGPRQPRAEVRDRTRWPKSRAHRPCGTGRQEGPPVAIARVVRISREQCTRPRTVFNLHVDRHPSYFAHGKLVHNCHLIPEDGEGMYRTFLAEAKVVNPHLRVIGLTATPFRLASGPICTPEGILNHICYEVGVRELIRDGYLCPLVTKAGINKADFERLHVRGGEFVADEIEDLMDEDRLVAAACAEIVAYTHDRRSVLVFAAGVRHGRHVARVLAEMSGREVGFLDGQTPAAERAELIARFRGEPVKADLLGQRAEPLKYLVNVNVLTTGFDAPNIDCVVMLRPTMSPGLWYQCLGRGFRLHPGKQNCLVLDFGGNALRHGPVDQLRMPDAPGRGIGQAPAKECPECLSVIAAGYARCPECGYEFPPPERQKHDARASTAGVLSGQVTDTEYEVLDIRYRVHTKRDAPPHAPKTMRVDYYISEWTYVSEWVCFEHTGYARWKAEKWWQRRSPDPVPDTAQRAVEIAEAGGVAWTEKIVVRSIAGENYDRIVGYTLAPKPEPVFIGDAGYDLDDVPF